MPVIANNIAANSAQRYLNINSAASKSSVSKIASGSRIVLASDDASGLAISNRLSADLSALRQGAINAAQARSLVQVADGGLARVGDILQRMKALAAQSRSGIPSDRERGHINLEFRQLQREISDISETTRFNGLSLLSSNEENANLSFAVGAGVDDTIDFSWQTLSDVSGYHSSVMGVGSTEGGNTGRAETVAGNEELRTFDFSVNTTSDAAQGVVLSGLLNTKSENYDAAAEKVLTTAEVEGTDGNVYELQLEIEYISATTADIKVDNFRLKGTAVWIDAATGTNSGDPEAGRVTFDATGDFVSFAPGANSTQDGDSAVLLDLSIAGGDENTALDRSVRIDVSQLRQAAAAVAPGDRTAGLVVESPSSRFLDLSGEIFFGDTDWSAANASFDFSVDVTVNGVTKAVIFSLDTKDALVGAGTSELSLVVKKIAGVDPAANTFGGIGLEIDQVTGKVIGATSVAAEASIADTIAAVRTALGNTTTRGSTAGTIAYGAQSATATDGVLVLDFSDVTFVDLALRGVDITSRTETATSEWNGTGVQLDVSFNDAGQIVDSQGARLLKGADLLVTDNSDVKQEGWEFRRSLGITDGTLSFVAAKGRDLVTFNITTAANQKTLGEQGLRDGRVKITSGVDVTTADNARTSATSIDRAIERISQARANAGSLISRFEQRGKQIATMVENTEAANSVLMDVDIAEEQSRLIANQVLTQAAVSALSQANQASQTLLRVLA